MGRPPKILWHSVDWSLSDTQIANSHALSAAAVGKKRRVLAPNTKSPGPNGRPKSPVPWHTADWSLSFPEIARSLNVSTTAVKQRWFKFGPTPQNP